VAAASSAETQAVLDELSHEIDRLNQENAALRQRVQLLTHRLFGRRSEKGVPVIEQGVLPLEPAAAGPVQPETTDESRQDETAEPASLRRRHPGRRRLPADLPRERIEVVPPASERHCATCDSAKVCTSAGITEKLDYVPASFVIREYLRPKCACGRCRQGVVQAVLPAPPIEKGRPGLGYWHTWSAPSTRTTCRRIGWSRSSCATECKSPGARSRSGTVRICSEAPW
jgi:transposase